MNRFTIGRFPPLSCACGEAMNTLCANLSFFSIKMMRRMAKLDKIAVLADADTRRSVISAKDSLRFSSSGEKPGFGHFLAGKVDMGDVLYQTLQRERAAR